MSLVQLDELIGLRAAAHGLSLRASRPARALLLGGHRSAQHGRGLEFEEVRPYVAGDDPRSIDWRVTARRGRPHTKLFREERERPVWILVDLHAGMFFGSRRQLKSTLAIRAASLLAWTGALEGDRVGAIVLGRGEPRILPPRGREAGVLPFLQTMLEVQPTSPEVPRKSDPADILQTLGTLMQPGSLLLALSDFAHEGTQTDTAWSRLATRNDCWLFWIVDALEAGGLPSGRFRAGLPGHIWTLDGRRSQQIWQETWQTREARITELARHFALPVTRLDTDTAVDAYLPPLLREARCLR